MACRAFYELDHPCLTKCFGVKRSGASAKDITSGRYPYPIGDECDIGADGDVTSCPVGALKCEPVVDHDEHQVGSH